MPLTIPDEVLEQAGLSEEQARIEIACRLFDAEKLDLWPAAQLAGMSRSQFENELFKRHIPVYRPSVASVQQDLANLQELGLYDAPPSADESTSSSNNSQTHY